MSYQKTSLIIGIDPGFTGALALYDPGARNVVDVWDMPLIKGTGVLGGLDKRPEIDPAGLARIISPLTSRLSLAVVERVSASPGAGVTSMFRFGEGYGMLVGVLYGCGVPKVLKPPPAVWKVSLGLSSDKRVSLAAVSQYLGEQVRHKYCPLVKDHGRAEAMLLAVYGGKATMQSGNS